MKYFLDTNICSYFLKGINENLRDRLLSENPNEIKIPSIVKAELLYGAEKSMKRDYNLKRISEFILPLGIIGFNDAEASEYGEIRADLEKKGTRIGPNELVIASIVKANNGILITNNTKEFSRVEGLLIEDWTK